MNPGRPRQAKSGHKLPVVIDKIRPDLGATDVTEPISIAGERKLSTHTLACSFRARRRSSGDSRANCVTMVVGVAYWQNTYPTGNLHVLYFSIL